MAHKFVRRKNISRTPFANRPHGDKKKRARAAATRGFAKCCSHVANNAADFQFYVPRRGGPGGRGCARRWNNIWPFAAVDFHQVIQLCCAVRVCLRSSRRTWCTRAAAAAAQRSAAAAAAVVYYPNCIIALCLRGYNVGRCICHGAPRLVYGRSNGLIALSTQLRNCLQFTISRPASRTLLVDQFYTYKRVYI